MPRLATTKVLALLCFSSIAASAQSLYGDNLVNALRNGGYVIVMRHASSPRTPPDDATANPDNPKHERQLDEFGRNNAITMGRALKNLRIPVGAVQSSPTYRSMQTVVLAELGTPELVPQLGDSGQNMSDKGKSGISADQTAWLKKRVTETPLVTNDFVVTHQPNIEAAFPEIKDVGEGEAIVFAKGGKMVARIAIVTWPTLVQMGAK